jgi:sarcosine oxidase, subunit gamma
MTRMEIDKMSKLQTQDKPVDFEGIARISQVSGLGMLTLRGDFSDKKFQAGLKKTTRLSLPVPRQIKQAGGLSLAWMSPDEALLIGPEDEVSEVLPLLEAALKNCHAMVVDVSDARAVFAISGGAARSVAAKLAPVDMRVSGFPIAEIRRTRFGQIAAAMWLPAEAEIRVICFRSVARFMFKQLCVAAAIGAEVGDW